MADGGGDRLRDEEMNAAEIEDDLYAFLNIPRDATQDDISGAYRRLSRLYHPDKHTDPARKKEADILFAKTKHAYEVLSDAHQRAIYDSVGARGLQTEGWEIVQRTRTPQEIREEYERLAKEKDERRLLQRTNPKGSITVNINATDFFDFEDEYIDFSESDGISIPRIEVSGMTFTQSIEAPLTLRDTALFSGQLSTHNGTGTGSVGVSIRRITSDCSWAEIEFGGGQGLSTGLRFFRSLGQRTFVNLSGSLQLASKGVRPGFVASVGTQLDTYTMGYLTWRGGSSTSGINWSLVRDTPSSHMSLGFQLGLQHTYLSVSATAKLTQFESKVRIAVKGGTLGILMEYGAEKKLSEQSTVGAALQIGVPSGITLRIRFQRANQVYAFPIHLSESIAPSPILYGTVVPIIIALLLQRLVLEPLKKERLEREKKNQRDANQQHMTQRKKEAECAVRLMQATHARLLAEEESRHGLVIVEALYGRLVAPIDLLNEDNEQQPILSEVVDVTVAMQCLVKDSRLTLHEASKSQLPGFYDPCVGEDKFLRVQYKFHDASHEVTVADTQPLRIPKHTHRVNNSGSGISSQGSSKED